jgi:hypothetical protein
MNVLCSATPCPVILNSTCVFYEGANLLYIGVNTNDSIQTALEKINYSLSNFSAPDLQSVTDVGATTTNEINFIGGIVTDNISTAGDVLTLEASNVQIILDDTASSVTVSGADFIANQSIGTPLVQAGQYRVPALNIAPVTPTSTGTLGEIRYTPGFIYVCIATNTWVRAGLATW